MPRQKVFRDTGFKPTAGSPGFMGIEVDESGKEAGPINPLGCLQFFTCLPFTIFVLAVPLIVIFWGIEQILKATGAM